MSVCSIYNDQITLSECINLLCFKDSLNLSRKSPSLKCVAAIALKIKCNRDIQSNLHLKFSKQLRKDAVFSKLVQRLN